MSHPLLPPPPSPPPPPLLPDVIFVVPTIASEVGKVVLTIAAIVALTMVLRRRRTMTSKDRNAGVVAFLGLSLCGRYIGLTHSLLDWLMVVPLAVLMLKVAYDTGAPDGFYPPREA